MNHFFITGLPRSRTAWLANLMTHGSSFCWHDAMSFCFNVEGLECHFDRKKTAIPGLAHMGDSDSALLIYHDEMLRSFPKAKWVIVYRTAEEATKSFWKQFGASYPYGPGTQEETERRFSRLGTLLDHALKINKDALVVGFPELKSEKVIRDIWDHCLPNVRFCHDRWRMLESIQMNVMPQKVVVAARRD